MQQRRDRDARVEPPKDAFRRPALAERGLGEIVHGVNGADFEVLLRKVKARCTLAEAAELAWIERRL